MGENMHIAGFGYKFSEDVTDSCDSGILWTLHVLMNERRRLQEDLPH
jgi:hypothetical protein